MKFNYKWTAAIVMLLLPLFILSSCKKNNTEQFNKASQTIFQYISTNKQLTFYQAALKRAGMFNAETFSVGGPFTVFAPVDSAFVKAGFSLDSINNYDPQSLALLLKYNIAYGKISNNSLVGFYAQDVICLNPTYKPNITKNYYGIFFNGIPLLNSVDLNDGAVHELTRMAMPPNGDLLDLIDKTPDLTLFTAAIKKIGYDTQISTQGTSNGPITLLAPSNEAFVKFGLPDVTSINNTAPSFLINIMNEYLLVPKVFTSNLKGGYAVRGSSNFYFDPDGFTIHSAGNILPTHIVRPDIVATNGVLEVVDQVIVPFNQ